MEKVNIFRYMNSFLVTNLDGTDLPKLTIDATPGLATNFPTEMAYTDD